MANERRIDLDMRYNETRRGWQLHAGILLGIVASDGRRPVPVV